MKKQDPRDRPNLPPINGSASQILEMPSSIAIGIVGAVGTSAGTSTAKGVGIALTATSEIVPEDAYAAEAPPMAAEFLTRLFVERKYREAVLGDRDEIFRADVAKYGRKTAQWFYWAETLRSITPQIYAAVKRVGWVTLIGSAVTRWLFKGS